MIMIDYLYVVMCANLDVPGVYPAVTAVFESRELADEFVNKCNVANSQLVYYIDTSFHNVLES